MNSAWQFASQIAVNYIEDLRRKLAIRLNPKKLILQSTLRQKVISGQAFLGYFQASKNDKPHNAFAGY